MFLCNLFCSDDECAFETGLPLVSSGQCFPSQTSLGAHGLSSFWFRLAQKAAFRYALDGHWQALSPQS